MMEMLTAPSESQLKNFMEFGKAGLATDQEAPPNQLAHIPKHHSELMKFCHLSSLPDIRREPHQQTPGFFRSPGQKPGQFLLVHFSLLASGVVAFLHCGSPFKVWQPD